MFNEFNKSPSEIKIMDFVKRHIKFIRYSIIGFSGVLVDNLMYYILVAHMQMYYQYANVIGVSCGIINNFLLNAFFNFKKKDKILLRFIQFFLVGLVGMAINAGLLYCFIELLHVNQYVAKFLNAFIVAIIQYLFNKAYSFKDKVNKKILVLFIAVLLIGYILYYLNPFGF